MKQATVAPEAQALGPNTKMWVCDKTGNRYYYDLSKVEDAYIKRTDKGYYIIFFGFKTVDVVPTMDKPEFNEPDPF